MLSWIRNRMRRCFFLRSYILHTRFSRVVIDQARVSRFTLRPRKGLKFPSGLRFKVLGLPLPVAQKTYLLTTYVQKP